ncbi:hypothetical protein V8E36_006980 [Tilletia maclaganii]
MASSSSDAAGSDHEDLAPRHGHDQLDPSEERRLIRKIDIAVGVPVFVLFLLSYLDRSNLGNALSAGMPNELDGFPANGANVATSVFCERSLLPCVCRSSPAHSELDLPRFAVVTYVVFETPSAMFFQLIGVRRAIAAITFAWGITTLCTGFVTTYAGLLAARLVLGACETGFFPIFAIYLTFWYSRTQIGLRTSYLFVAAAVSGAFGGLLAAAILNIPASTGKPSWAYLYFIEGGVTVVAGIAAYFVLADDFENAWFLNEREREIMRIRERRNEYQGSARASKQTDSEKQDGSDSPHGYNWAEAALALKDPKTWLSATAQFGADSCLFAFATFLPTIIRTFNPLYSTIEIQLLTVGAAIFTDKKGHRWAVLTASSILIIVGFAILLATDARSFGPRYFATFLTSLIYTIVGLNVSWLNMNNALSIKRSGILAGQIFLTTDAPAYTRGYATCLGLVGYSMTAYLAMALLLSTWNAARERQQRLVRNEVTAVMRNEDRRFVQGARAGAEGDEEHTRWSSSFASSTNHTRTRTTNPSDGQQRHDAGSFQGRRRWLEGVVGDGLAFGEPVSFKYAL